MRGYFALRLFAFAVSMAILAGGCSAVARRMTRPLVDSLSLAVMKQRDVEMVRAGAPSYLLMMDGLLQNDPENEDLLVAAAQMYSAYGSAFVMGDNPQRAKLIAEKARDYAFRALSLRNEAFGRLHDQPFEKFSAILPTLRVDDAKCLLAAITTWAGYIQTHADSMDNLADIAKLEALTMRLLELDEGQYYGAGHLVMGVLKTLLPGSLGGKPEEAKTHFEKAIELSKGRFLQAQVMYAEKYARMTGDRELHDRLLKQVLDTPADIVPELTLVNTLAQRKAEAMLADADDYF